MLFVLDDSLNGILENRSHSLHETLCVELERIALARFHQKLVLFVESSRFVELARDSDRLTNRAKAVLSGVDRARSFKGGLARSVAIRCRIVADGARIEVANAGGIAEIRVPVALVPYGLFDACIVLAENLDDAKAYLILTRMEIASSQGAVPRVPLKGELRGGGGSTTEKEYLQIKSAGERLVLCLLDDDVRYPGGNYSGWRDRIVASDVSAPSPISANHCLGAYSIENVLPLDVFHKVPYFADPTRSVAVTSDVKHWTRHASEGHWPYMPLKKSIPCTVFRLSTDEGSFWRTVAGHFGSYSSKDCARTMHACSSACERIPKYSAETLREFSAAFEGAPDAQLADLAGSVPPAMSDKLASLARTVVSWCCVGRPLGALPAG